MLTGLGPDRRPSHWHRRLTGTQQILRNSATFVGLFILAALIARHPDLFNRPVARAISGFVSANNLVGNIAYMVTIPRVQGIILAALLCYSWFSFKCDKMRDRLIAGVLASIFAAIVAQVVEASLVTSAKPIFDPMVQFHVPAELGTTSFGAPYRMHTFPSPRAALYCGLAIAILVVQPMLGALALCITLLIEGARILVGFHYPTDIVGSLLLAAASVSASQLPPIVARCDRILNWESAYPAAFHTCFFILLIELSMSFEGARGILALLSRML